MKKHSKNRNIMRIGEMEYRIVPVLVVTDKDGNVVQKYRGEE